MKTNIQQLKSKRFF